MRGANRAVLIAIVVIVIAGAGAVWFFVRTPFAPPPGCTVAGATAGSSGFTLSPEQTDNAATIAAVGQRLGMPDHAVTVALATAIQESDLANLSGGDRDSAGLFQQRPSQGWGTYAQVTDPVHASLEFYDHLRALSDWQQLTVTEAAQQVQHSAAPQAYAEWEPEARALAVALTGEATAALTCHNLTITAPSASLTDVAAAEWGTSTLSGPHSTARGWAISSWLVAHAMRLGIDRVTFAGRTWTAASGSWTQAGSAADTLSLHQVPVTTKPQR
ncbi:MAG TPA: hypothetical protein VFW65_31230 [Pseudonocardiaceae bacterium]|nr:hypothetical protein [Pseudonocardiaceae bacterium]